uniref:Uncharacterized protein n=1 Tax=Arundo donax TaxID=35708 RepID=A0A0A9AHH2_ARUDO
MNCCGMSACPLRRAASKTSCCCGSCAASTMVAGDVYQPQPAS